MLSEILKTCAVALVNVYQKTFALIFGGQCRFTPSCSEYTKEALMKFGVIKGSRLGFFRICKCHPWGGHGYDPVEGK